MSEGLPAKRWLLSCCELRDAEDAEKPFDMPLRTEPGNIREPSTHHYPSPKPCMSARPLGGYHARPKPAASMPLSACARSHCVPRSGARWQHWEGHCDNLDVKEEGAEPQTTCKQGLLRGCGQCLRLCFVKKDFKMSFDTKARPTVKGPFNQDKVKLL